MATNIAALFTLLKGPDSTAGREDKSLYFDQTSSFTKLGLDRRLFKAVAKTGYIYPSIVQTSTIPLVLEGRDVLVRARTGTGKTAAYLLPVLHQLLDTTGGAAAAAPGVRAIVLVPTRDLCDQVRDSVRTFASYARDVITCVTLNADSKKALTLEASQLKTNPNLVVATPGRLLQHLAAGTLSVKHSLKTLVVDEADLVLSYGYEDDVKALNGHFPEFFQCVLMSATLTPELDALKALLLHNPAVVKLDEGGASASSASGALSQYFMLCPKQDKLLLLYTHAALGLYKGKTLFFVNSVADAFHLKLFLEQFSINAAVLNDDLPYNSRRNIVLQFNRGVFDYLIATDLCADEVDVEEEARVEGAVKMQVFSDTGSGRKGVDLLRAEQAADDSDSGSGSGSDDDDEEEEEDDEVKAEAISDDSDSDGGSDSDGDSGRKRKAGGKGKGAVAVKQEAVSDDSGVESGDEEVAPKGKKAREADAKVEKKEKKEKKEEAALAPSAGLLPSSEVLTPSSQLPAQRAGESEDAFLSRLETAETARRARSSGSSSDRTGVARGIDFVDVQTVVNVDFPLTYKSYTHRVGRTARAGKAGQAISYVCKEEQPLLESVMESQSVTESGGVVATREPDLKPLPISLESANSFRYRVEECRRKVTTTAVKNARLAAIRVEMLNSARLRAHFEDNPHELALLKHNKALTSRKKVNKHLNFVPSYLIPAEFRALGIDGGKVELGAHGGGLSSRSGRRHRVQVTARRGKEMDPLQSFAYSSKIDDENKGFKARERDEFAKRGHRKYSKQEQRKLNRHRK